MCVPPCSNRYEKPIRSTRQTRNVSGWTSFAASALQSRRSHPFRRNVELIVRQRHAGRVDAVVRRLVNDHADHAASDIEKLVARLQAQLPADVIELLDLRSMDVLLPGAEVCA